MDYQDHKLNSSMQYERLAQKWKRFPQELRKRLKEKIEQKEEIMNRAHKREIEELLSKSKNKTALKIKQALLAHKHLIEMEKFRCSVCVIYQILTSDWWKKNLYLDNNSCEWHIYKHTGSPIRVIFTVHIGWSMLHCQCVRDLLYI